jgi:hypothetical protein
MFNNPGFAQQEGLANDDDSPINLALVANPSASFTSGDTTVAALNDGFEPRNSRARGRGNSYGNWPRRQTQWVQYEWSQPISTNRIDVYWWADGQGVGLPIASRLLYWSENELVPVPRDEGLGEARDRFNTTTF